jgi:hypothetical protein
LPATVDAARSIVDSGLANSDSQFALVPQNVANAGEPQADAMSQ